MDDFTSGPNEFFIIFNSDDKSIEKEENGYRFFLKTPLEFSTEWEVGIQQIILKHPFRYKNILSYIHKEGSDDKGVTKTIDLGKPDSITNKDELVEYFNKQMPEALRKDLYLEIDDRNFAFIKAIDKQFRLEADYFNQVLGIPSKYYKGTGFIKGERPIKLFSPHPIFHILVDIITPISFGLTLSQILLTDIFPNDTDFRSYKYSNISYNKILRSYISSFLISTTDINFNFFESKHPILIKFHFRRSFPI